MHILYFVFIVKSMENKRSFNKGSLFLKKGIVFTYPTLKSANGLKYYRENTEYEFMAVSLLEFHLIKEFVILNLQLQDIFGNYCHRIKRLWIRY